MASKKHQPITLDDLLVLKLQALYDVEQELVKALPKMVKAASDPELKDGFASHLDETKGHVMRLEEVFRLLDLPPKKLRGDAIRGLISDAAWVIKNIKTPEARDANLIAAASYVEHYEMAGYLAAREWAATLGNSEIAALLGATLTEEETANEKLSALASSKINDRASMLNGMQEE